MTETFASPLQASSRATSMQAPRGNAWAFTWGWRSTASTSCGGPEIRSDERPTRLAHSPDFIKGVIDLRGCIVPIEALLGRGEIELVINATRG